MRRKGFTLVELLVVIAIIALLMGILMPALARVRQLAFRMTCGTNLSGIGKAMLIYANDYEDELPRAGGRNANWGATQWNALTRAAAYNDSGTTSTASISSCFYLLVKYAEVTPKSFICKGDTGTNEFQLSEEPPSQIPNSDFELIDAWDFGSEPTTHCSYSYHIPFSVYALSISSEPGLAVASERNPWLDSPGAEAKTSAEFNTFVPDTTELGGDNETAIIGNAVTHQGDGQNVLYLDSHVDFAKRSFCGLEEDNIFTESGFTTGSGDPKGVMPVYSSSFDISSRKDSCLLHDIEGKPVNTR
jgi:prepilin-type N-terminal cleavage/methylation domain-containing protein